jgi:toxin ParE1/3/4
MVEINWSEKAKLDLDAIAEYIAMDSEYYAKRFVSSMLDFINSLKLQPQKGKVVPEFNISSLREIIHGKYRIIYYYEGNQNLNIVAIRHSARLLKEL